MASDSTRARLLARLHFPSFIAENGGGGGLLASLPIPPAGRCPYLRDASSIPYLLGYRCKFPNKGHLRVTETSAATRIRPAGPTDRSPLGNYEVSWIRIQGSESGGTVVVVDVPSPSGIELRRALNERVWTGIEASIKI